jgi:hypothetical protein
MRIFLYILVRTKYTYQSAQAFVFAQCIMSPERTAETLDNGAPTLSLHHLNVPLLLRLVHNHALQSWHITFLRRNLEIPIDNGHG